VSGLLAAVIFSVLLNGTLVACLIWPAMLPSGIKGLLLASTLAVWAGGWIDARRVRRLADLVRQRDPQLDLFLSARGEYLKSRWAEAEQFLVQLLWETPDDVEARLMLATLLRHECRWEEAKEQLRRLQRWSRAAAWNLEIRREWERLLRGESAVDTADQPGRVERETQPPGSGSDQEAA
jgi:hypothetical protein